MASEYDLVMVNGHIYNSHNKMGWQIGTRDTESESER